MAKLNTYDNFTIEVPKEDGTMQEIKGILLPETKTFKKELKQKYDDKLKSAIKLQKENKELMRLNQKIENVSERIKIAEGEEKKELLNEQQTLLDRAYKLSDKLEKDSNGFDGDDIQEGKAVDHIENRVESKQYDEIVKLGEQYGYVMVLNTILEDVEQGKQKNESD